VTRIQGETIQAPSKRTPLLLELDHTGEGLFGDYEDGDSCDVPLMRFTLFLVQGDGELALEISDCSYCTHIPATLPESELEEIAAYLLEQFESSYLLDSVFDNFDPEDFRPKRLAQQLSWCDGLKEMK